MSWRVCKRQVTILSIALDLYRCVAPSIFTWKNIGTSTLTLGYAWECWEEKALDRNLVAVWVIQTGTVDIWHNKIRKVSIFFRRSNRLLECTRSVAALPIEGLSATFVGGIIVTASVPNFVWHILDVLVHIFYLLFVLEDGLRYLARRADLQSFLPFKIIWIPRFKYLLKIFSVQRHWVLGCRRFYLSWLRKAVESRLSSL